uniref:AAA domain-containing protein n=1 Tax=Candidatus Kentrum sp. MB TaxID=2138164 RepID=A0A451B7E2_9GAMM|nr:MAG: AAA domain-containing protein [Candidatus Kentron sp. MB]VFK74200.1 MAG: AAA domain-containing protein [Candidatus Kentron sp. MB]
MLEGWSPVSPAGGEVSRPGSGAWTEGAPVRVLDGQTTPITFTLRNRGQGRVYWVDVAQTRIDNRFLFQPPPTKVILEPGEQATLTGHVSFSSRYQSPQGARDALALTITSAHGEPIPLTIPVMAHTPRLALQEAVWERPPWWRRLWQRWFGADQGPMDTRLALALTNPGEQALTETEFTLRVPGLEAKLDTLTRKSGPPGPLGEMGFALPAGFAPDEDSRVTLEAFQLGPPAHRWRLEQAITIPPPPWESFALLAALFLLTLGGIYYLRLYRHPLVRRLSATPEGFLRLSPGELPLAKGLLHRTRRLSTVLRAAGVSEDALAAALAHPAQAGAVRCRTLATRLGSEPEPLAAGLWRLPLGENFPINLTECLLYLPDRAQPAPAVLGYLDGEPVTAERVVLILHPVEAEQERLRAAADDPGNLYIAPAPAGLTELLLAPEPMLALARMASRQLRLTRLSPYRTGGGVVRDSMFFGRDQLIAHVMNREPANYLVVGGRQLGKSSLLKALERRYRDRQGVDCHYLSLSDAELLPRLARTLDLPLETELDALIAHLSQGAAGRRVLFLIDEADKFVEAEASRDYGTLRRLRSLSEEGRAHFVLAGFWQLYRHVALDYQSPLRNFGEVLSVGALEPDACRALATEPMARMGLDYEAAALAHLLTMTGQRANLIVVACNEILKTLGSLTQEARHRRIVHEDVNKALTSQAIRSALDGWEEATGIDPTETRLGRMVVYATVEQGDFQLEALVERLSMAAEEVARKTGIVEHIAVRDLKTTLERLSLAYIIGEEEGVYRYRAPLFRERIRMQAPGLLLADEFRSGAAG